MYNDGLVNLITKYNTRILSNLESKERSITGKNIKKHRRRSKQNQLSIYLSKLASVLFPATRCPFCFDLIWLRSGYIHRYMRHLLLVLVLLRLWHSVLRCAVLYMCPVTVVHCRFTSDSWVESCANKVLWNHGSFFTTGSEDNSAKCEYTCNKIHQFIS